MQSEWQADRRDIYIYKVEVLKQKKNTWKQTGYSRDYDRQTNGDVNGVGELKIK